MLCFVHPIPSKTQKDICDIEDVLRNKDCPEITLLTHQRTEGNDSQESLDQDAEPVGQCSVIAAVRTQLVDVRHVCDFKNAIVQESFHQEDPAVSIHVHVDTIKKNNTAVGHKRCTPSVG